MSLDSSRCSTGGTADARGHRLRVAHFGKFAFLRVGGVERHVVELTTGLAKRGVDVTVFAYDVSGTAEAGVECGVRVVPVPAAGSLSSQPLAPMLVSRSRHIARAHRFDVIHQHWPDPFAHLAASLVPGGAAQVVSWHSDVLRQRVLGPLYRAVAQRLFVKPHAVIGATGSHLASSQLGLFAPPQKRHIIPYGIDTRPFVPCERTIRDAQSLRDRYGGGPLVFALGRHVSYKGFDILIRAMARVPAVLLLGGDGPLTPDLRRLAAAVAARVQFVGTIPDEALPAYYHACDVFCLPSVTQAEAFGLVQAEAMACGKPIVNTVLGNGVNEVAPHDLCALSVPPGDETMLAGALNRLLQERELVARMGKAGLERVRSSFTVDAMVSRVLDLYESLVRQRP